jgi:hypothetical protein
MAGQRNNRGRGRGVRKSRQFKIQLRENGLTAVCIRGAVDEAEFLGLVRCQRGGRYNGSNQPSTYRLTFYADGDGNPATNDWKRVTQEQISEWQEDRRQKRSGRKKQKAASRSRSTVDSDLGVPPSPAAAFGKALAA